VTRPPSDPQVLRDSVTREVTNDAYSIAQQIFKGPMPDVSRVSNEQLDARYRQAFLSNDRNYLMQEAARDPVQFLASMERLGVTAPPDKPVETQPPLPKAAKPNVPLPPAPVHANPPTYGMPEDVPPPQLPPVAVPPPLPIPAAATGPAQPPPPGVIPGI